MTRILLLALAVVMLALPGAAVATAQESDIIRIDGKTHALNTNPLRAFLAQREWRPPEDAQRWSSNWRGYVAEWEISNGRLWLVEMTVRFQGKEPRSSETRSQMETLFPSGGPALAEWYTGALIIPEGELTSYVHMGYASTYERYQVFRIADGIITEHLRLSGEEFERYKAEKFEAFTGTPAYRQAFAEIRASSPDWPDEQVIGFMRDFYSEKYLSH